MKLLTPPWKTAWYDDQISDRFFQEMSRMENSMVKGLENSTQWMNQLVIEIGQLAQNMTQLESDGAHSSQIRLAFEKALKISTLSAHLAAALDRADPDLRHTPVGAQTAPTLREIPMPTPRAETNGGAAAVQVAGGEELQPAVAPLRQTVNGLSRRGLSVAEIEVITGQSRSQIESVLNER